MDAERMSLWAFEDMPAWAMALSLAAHLAVGGALGIAYFNAVWWTARQLALGGRATVTIVLTIGRFVLLGGALALTSLEGALPLLMAALGVLIARAAVVRTRREAAP
jgi:F1F0 ATPase subunit 2